MFKCCICNNISKKTNAETKSKRNDTPIGSPRVTTISTKVDDEIKIIMRADKLNGNLQRSEDTFSAALDFTPIRINSTIKNSCEIAQNENANIKDKSNLVSIKKETGNLIDKDNSNFDDIVEDQMENVNFGAKCAIKTNLYDASGYIERTIDDGPEDEGDDSVFEACSSGNETAKKTPPGITIR